MIVSTTRTKTHLVFLITNFKANIALINCNGVFALAYLLIKFVIKYLMKKHLMHINLLKYINFD